MGVYQIYTNTVHIPTFILYKCQKCNTIVSTVGTYDISASYSNKGTKKQVNKRTTEHYEMLTKAVNEKTQQLRNDVQEIGEDYPQIQCKCPKCGNESLCKISASANEKISLKIAIVITLVVTVFSLADIFMRPGGIGQKSFGDIIFGVFTMALFLVFGIGLVSTFVKFIINMIMKSQTMRLFTTVPPLASSDRNKLIQASRERDVYKNVDFSEIMKYPAILELKK